MERIPLVDLQAAHRKLIPDILPLVEAVMARSDFVLGSEVDRFETSFARFCGAQWAVGVANGTEAIHLALRALSVGRGDEVLVPANTFIATALGVTYTGARPVLVDCSEDDFLMDLRAAESKITDRTKIVLPVHLFGRMVDPEPILDLCARRGLTMVEDAAQAHGAETSGRRAGAAGTAGCFSFFPGKNLGAFGDAGAVVTSDASVRDRLRALRNYGSTEKYHHPEVGFNCRLDTIQAVVLNYKLERLPDASRARLRHAKGYQDRLSGVGDLILPDIPDDGSHVFHLFVVRTARRDDMLSYLHELGVMAGIHYPTPIHLHGAFHHLDEKEGAFPVAEKLAQEIISLPLYPELTDQQLDRVAEVVRRFFEGGPKDQGPA